MNCPRKRDIPVAFTCSNTSVLAFSHCVSVVTESLNFLRLPISRLLPQWVVYLRRDFECIWSLSSLHFYSQRYLFVCTVCAHTGCTYMLYTKGSQLFWSRQQNSRFLSCTQKLDQKENKPKKAFMNLVLQLKTSVLSIERIQKSIFTDCWSFHS